MAVSYEIVHVTRAGKELVHQYLSEAALTPGKADRGCAAASPTARPSATRLYDLLGLAELPPPKAVT